MIFPSNSESFVEGLKSTTLLFKTMFLFLALKTTVVDSTRFWEYPFESILLSYLKHAICHPKWQVYDTESKEFPNQKSYLFSVFLTKKVSFWCFFCWDVFFGKSWRMYFFMLHTLSFWKFHDVAPQNLPGDSVENIKDPRLLANLAGRQVYPGENRVVLFFWWTAGGEHRANARHQRFSETSPGYHLGSVILSAFLKTLFRGLFFFWVFCCKCWGDYVNIYLYIYLHIYINIYLYIFIFIYIYIYIYIFFFIYIHLYIYVQLYAYDFYIINIYINMGPQKQRGGGYKKSLGGTFRIWKFFRRFRQPGLTNSMVRTCTDLGWIVIEIRRMNGSKLSPRLLGRVFFYHLLMGLFQKKSPDNEDWNLTLWRTNVRQWIVFCMNVDSWISNWKVRLVGVSSLTC